MISYYCYLSYPFPSIAPLLEIGIYAKGSYYHMKGDPYTTLWTRELFAAVVLSTQPGGE